MNYYQVPYRLVCGKVVTVCCQNKYCNVINTTMHLRALNCLSFCLQGYHFTRFSVIKMTECCYITPLNKIVVIMTQSYKQGVHTVRPGCMAVLRYFLIEKKKSVSRLCSVTQWEPLQMDILVSRQLYQWMPLNSQNPFFSELP